MRSTEKIRENAAVVYPEGNLDIHAVIVLEEIFNLAMEDFPGCNILVDLSDAGHISSSCLRIFVSTHAALNRSGLKLVLFNANAINRKVLELTEVDSLISVFDSREQAVASIAK